MQSYWDALGPFFGSFLLTLAILAALASVVGVALFINRKRKRSYAMSASGASKKSKGGDAHNDNDAHAADDHGKPDEKSKGGGHEEAHGEEKPAKPAKSGSKGFDKAKLGPIAAVLVFVIGIALGAYWLVHRGPPGAGGGPLIASAPPFGTPAPVSACGLPKTPYRFEAKEPSVKFNPYGRCAPDIWAGNNCIMVRYIPAGQTKAAEPVKVCPGDSLPNDVESAWSAGEPFDGFVALSPPRYAAR